MHQTNRQIIRNLGGHGLLGIDSHFDPLPRWLRNQSRGAIFNLIFSPNTILNQLIMYQNLGQAVRFFILFYVERGGEK